MEPMDDVSLPVATQNEINCNKDVCEEIYGNEIANELKRLKVFVVGAGAIGCELLKNFALMNMSIGMDKVDGDGSKNPDNSIGHHSVWKQSDLINGGVVVTDMDHIERSNLNRQLLFRQHHVGQPKSLVAVSEVLFHNFSHSTIKNRKINK